MGVTITVALCIWITGSLIEYRVISRIPAMEKVFHGIPGMFISIGIGFAVGMALGASTGAGFILGQTMGLATNQVTFQMWSTLHKANTYRKVKTKQWNAFYEANHKVIGEAINTVRLGAKALGAIFLAFMFIIGLPVRIIEWFNKRKSPVHP